jgi:hypothetical protein
LRTAIFSVIISLDFEGGGIIDMEYIPHGVCSRLIHVELDGNIVKNVEFVGGCSGNTQGISHLVRGMDVHEAISRLQGIRCGNKATSCPDQLSYALKQAIGE